jgi:predicted dehydrogenase
LNWREKGFIEALQHTLRPKTNYNMNESTNSNLSSRREFIKTTGRVAAASALAGMALPYVHAAGNESLQVALIGCGGRGTGAAANAMNVKSVPVKLVAMVDVFPEKLNSSYEGLSNKYGDKVDVPQERKFIGFDGYQHAMDCLKPGDIAIFTTPLAFRWVHFAYAVQKGLNVFMEKPLTADGPTSRRMLDLAKQASAKNLKVGVGLMCRHHRPLQELARRAQEGELGEIILMRGYRMAASELAACFSERWPGNPSELLWQISRFHSFIWASGGLFNDFYIHHIDHLCMIKNAWPVKAQALGGRHYRRTRDGKLFVDQNFDSYSVEYTFADGTKMYMDGRNENGCNEIYSSYVHGSKGMAIAASSGDYGRVCSIHSAQNPTRQNTLWSSNVSKEEQDPYDNEWNDLVDAIRNDKPYNEVPRGIQASVTSSLGRMAAHTGQEVTYDEMLNHPDEYAPGADKYTLDSPPPLRSDANGVYPIPMPGILKHSEYAINAT